MPTLLLVDDNEGLRLTLSAILEDEGFVVDCAGSLAEARRALAAGASDYAAVLLDLHLRDGLGTDLVPLLRALHPRAKVIVLSGAEEPGRHARNADAALLKGDDFNAIVARVRALVEGPD